MGDIVEVAPTGRAKCRGCKETIPKGEIRFGETYDSAFSDGESLRYWHLLCAAKKLPARLEPAMTAFGGAIPNKAEVDAEMAKAKKSGKASAGARFPHAQIASTGRARCLGCSEPLEKGKLRVAVEREIEGPMGLMKSPGYLHPACALGWAEEQGEDSDGFAEQVLANSGHLTDDEKRALVADLGGGGSGDDDDA
ncbi:MAG: hypothetical protein ABMB14_14275 [Myxococcota bacterium]